ncbi:hypothetical protein PATSB16_24790 [Pandoraea thiooxydans]|uniref:Hydrogenase assembly protein HupF n=1 Tax=Pandoraea thiooxydans TaxID=445709 RepID=A0A0G3ET15_9BURK|nr:HypC/HybG/HupF family hydrogenase formation chaperone [Pandoraea thiooxydans]AKJ68447.1 hydrogenase assembly protein HupF [Pandoraea thiooxydans]APR95819.1 hypothetical protein PATSB16_24790 [Pandoraea thiooxydans]
MCLAVPGRILDTDGDDPLTRQGRVDFAGIVKQVNLAYVPQALAGQYVLVHAGLAIAVLDEQEALRTLACFTEENAEEGDA